MQKSHDPRLDLSVVRAHYNDPSRYTNPDSWHRFTAKAIRRGIRNHWNSVGSRPDSVILNAGAGGNDLGLLPDRAISLDIAEQRIRGASRPVVGSVEKIPLTDCSVDVLLCVGSVLNYCDAAVAISEFHRVLKPHGNLILEFESSKSGELIRQQAFGQSVAIAETFFGTETETVWVYSPTHVRNLLVAAGFTKRRHVPIHVLSPWVLLIFRSLDAAALIAHLDLVARHVPILPQWSSNHLFFYQRRT